MWSPLRHAGPGLLLGLALLSFPALSQQMPTQQTPPQQAKGTATQSVAVPAREAPGKAPSRVLLTSAAALSGCPALNRLGEEMGQLEYVLIDGRSGEVRYALIGSGGLLDLGEEVTPVDWSKVTVVPGDLYGAVMLNALAEELEQGRRVSLKDIRSMASPSLVTRFQEFLVPAGETQGSGSSGKEAAKSGAGGQDRPESKAAASPAVRTQTDGTRSDGARSDGAGAPEFILAGRETVMTLAAPELMTPDAVRGAAVSTSDGEDVGDIEQIMIDVERGQVPYVLVGRGGFLGVGEEWIPVPFRALTWSATQAGFVLNADREKLGKMPALAKGDLPDRVKGSDLKTLYDRFGVTPYWQERQG
ncbi:PRC-barrel domain-containing protein [Azospirillum sp. SYSU D00513]|uniref:PRC-barrel domain-containing protein n=1 Tax=Azospirillum sp. SYSU D00513 TaxID=2812561 RepID=UPI001A97682F|nr:PRC-barrel domain-containing protein [Azospirillum sp. SYSU D00513]